jgi:biotin carboxyl carrier protein
MPTVISTYNATVNGALEVAVKTSDLLTLDKVQSNKDHYHILHNYQSYNVEVMGADYAAKTFSLKVNGSTHHVQLDDELDTLIKQLGLTIKSNQKSNHLKAPMPGLVLEVMVNAGQTVKKGDTLLILEAMKMENSLKCQADAVVKMVHVKKGTAVEKGELLIEMEG